MQIISSFSIKMKYFREACVIGKISINKLDRLINNFSANNFIFFNDNKIPPGNMC